MKRRHRAQRPHTLDELAALGDAVRAECADLPVAERSEAVRRRLAEHGTTALQTIQADLAVPRARQEHEATATTAHLRHS